MQLKTLSPKVSEYFFIEPTYTSVNGTMTQCLHNLDTTPGTATSLGLIKLLVSKSNFPVSSYEYYTRDKPLGNPTCIPTLSPENRQQWSFRERLSGRPPGTMPFACNTSFMNHVPTTPVIGKRNFHIVVNK